MSDVRWLEERELRAWRSLQFMQMRLEGALAQQLAAALPDMVVAAMDKKVRGGKVFIDWSQNNGAKTTIAPYSMRGRAEPTVSTPITWDEVEDATAASDLVFTTVDVLERVEEHGDLLTDMSAAAAPLP